MKIGGRVTIGTFILLYIIAFCFIPLRMLGGTIVAVVLYMIIGGLMALALLAITWMKDNDPHVPKWFKKLYAWLGIR